MRYLQWNSYGRGWGVKCLELALLRHPEVGRGPVLRLVAEAETRLVGCRQNFDRSICAIECLELALLRHPEVGGGPVWGCLAKATFSDAVTPHPYPSPRGGGRAALPGLEVGQSSLLLLLPPGTKARMRRRAAPVQGLTRPHPGHSHFFRSFGAVSLQ